MTTNPLIRPTKCNQQIPTVTVTNGQHHQVLIISHHWYSLVKVSTKVPWHYLDLTPGPEWHLLQLLGIVFVSSRQSLTDQTCTNFHLPTFIISACLLFIYQKLSICFSIYGSVIVCRTVCLSICLSIHHFFQEMHKVQSPVMASLRHSLLGVK